MRATEYLQIFLFACAAWSLCIGAHELLGHGGVCAVDPHCAWYYADAMYFHGIYEDERYKRIMIAAGSLLNILLSGACAFMLLHYKVRKAETSVFGWLFASAGLIQSGAYMAFGPSIHPAMDWSQLAVNAHGYPAREIFFILGMLILALGAYCSWRLQPFSKHRIKTTLVSMLGFSLTALAASAFVPTDNRWFMLMGGIGSGTLFMLPFLISCIPRKQNTEAAMTINYKLSTAALCVSLVYVVLLGSGVHFSQ